MKVSELAELMANATGIDAGRVKTYARRLREDGVLPSEGRGLSAADVEPGHAFDLLLACLISDTAAQAPKRLRNYYRELNRANDDGFVSDVSEKTYIQHSLGRFADEFKHALAGRTARETFASLIAAERDNLVISTFGGRDRHNHVMLRIRWHEPSVEFLFRDKHTATDARGFYEDNFVHFGGVFNPEELPRSAIHYTAFIEMPAIRKIATGFVDARTD